MDFKRCPRHLLSSVCAISKRDGVTPRGERKRGLGRNGSICVDAIPIPRLVANVTGALNVGGLNVQPKARAPSIDEIGAGCWKEEFVCTGGRERNLQLLVILDRVDADVLRGLGLGEPGIRDARNADAASHRGKERRG